MHSRQASIHRTSYTKEQKCTLMNSQAFSVQGQWHSSVATLCRLFRANNSLLQYYSMK